MRPGEKIAPVAALAAAVVSISCCLPFAVPAALGLAGLSVFAGEHQGWLIGASVVLLAAGAGQLVRRRACERRSRVSIVLLCVSAMLVLAVVFFPQSIAGFLADHLP